MMAGKNQAALAVSAQTKVICPFKKLDIFARAHIFSYAQDFFVKKMTCNLCQRIVTQMANFAILNTKT